MGSEVGKEKVQVIISPYDMRIQERDIDIPEIEWEDELYTKIGNALKQYKFNQTE